MRLSGKRVLAVGASSGIGQASALAVANQGARVCLASRRTDRITQAARDAGDGAFALACDVRDETSCRSVVAEASQLMGGLDAVVYAPGISTFGPIEEIDAEGWRATDIGGAKPPGRETTYADGSIEVFGGGNDIWGASDDFRFIWREIGTLASLSSAAATVSAGSARPTNQRRTASSSTLSSR